MRNLDLTILRSFVTVVETGGVTQAAGILNLTQSAVSMQLKRLEELLAVEVLQRAGRKLVITPAGEQLLGFAKRMVELNDEVFLRMTDRTHVGAIALGVPTDIVFPHIPNVLKRFNAEFPQVKVQLISSFTAALKDEFRKGEIDIILTTEQGLDAGGETLKEAALRWIGAPQGKAWQQRPLPFASCQSCNFRSVGFAALDQAGIAWTDVVTSESEIAAEASASADLAVLTRLEGHHPPHLELIEPNGQLPDLGTSLVNIYGPVQKTEFAQRLKEIIRVSFAGVS
ncbi:MAG: LysR family transcriptional regulator [Paracoccaceae bacterium]|nr:LysR family transcriptional regulator [Paracoccaceae bacterium]